MRRSLAASKSEIIKRGGNLFSYGLLVMAVTHVLTHVFTRVYTALFPSCRTNSACLSYNWASSPPSLPFARRFSPSLPGLSLTGSVRDG
jgi:hypothetical protein